MANVTISGLAAGTALTGTEPFPGVQAGNTVKFTATQIATFAWTTPVLTGNVSLSTIITPATNTNLTITPNGTGKVLVSSDILGSAYIRSNGATNGIGYATGAGGTVTQATSKATGVTLSKVCGQITTAADALAAATSVSFVVTNTAVAAGDVMVLNLVSGGTAGAYTLNAACAAGSATITIRNVTAASLSETLVIGFVLVKAVTA